MVRYLKQSDPDFSETCAGLRWLCVVPSLALLERTARELPYRLRRPKLPLLLQTLAPRWVTNQRDTGILLPFLRRLRCLAFRRSDIGRITDARWRVVPVQRVVTSEIIIRTNHLRKGHMPYRYSGDRGDEPGVSSCSLGTAGKSYRSSFVSMFI